MHPSRVYRVIIIGAYTGDTSLKIVLLALEICAPGAGHTVNYEHGMVVRY